MYCISIRNLRGGEGEAERERGRRRGKSPTRNVASMAVAPDGTAMATSGYDGLVKIWVGSAARDSVCVRARLVRAGRGRVECLRAGCVTGRCVCGRRRGA